MAGGKFSFGSGGYFESPIDPLLPVSMELREDHRTLSVAMANRDGPLRKHVRQREWRHDQDGLGQRKAQPEASSFSARATP